MQCHLSLVFGVVGSLIPDIKWHYRETMVVFMCYGLSDKLGLYAAMLNVAGDLEIRNETWFYLHLINVTDYLNDMKLYKRVRREKLRVMNLCN
jgi:hypothetical protein